MHDIEPHYNWRNYYIASKDPHSPFYGHKNSEVFFTDTIYDHYIHPQWDSFGSLTMYMKLLYCDYEKAFCIIEFIGEWNDLIYNDIMYFYREVAEVLIDNGIKYFILLGDNVLNFHADGNDYYSEWFDNIEEGWIAGVNFRKHILEEMTKYHIDYYILTGGNLNQVPWRSMNPEDVFVLIDKMVMKRLQ